MFFLSVFYNNENHCYAIKSITKQSFSGGQSKNAARTLIFKVNKPALTEMMKSPGSTYKGNVTIIYDAAI